MVSLLSSRVSAPETPAPAPRRRGSIARNRRRLGIAYATPMAVLVAVFFVIPLGLMLWMSVNH
jgi:multiple sugar transport system permease protein